MKSMGKGLPEGRGNMSRDFSTARRSAAKRRLWAFATLASVVVLTALSQAAPSLASSTAACAATGSETVTSDNSSYQAGDSVAISGNGYAVSCDVTVEIDKPDSSKD